MATNEYRFITIPLTGIESENVTTSGFAESAKAKMLAEYLNKSLETAKPLETSFL